MYGHVAKLAQAELKGIEGAGGKADVYQYVLRLPQHHTVDSISSARHPL